MKISTLAYGFIVSTVLCHQQPLGHEDQVVYLANTTVSKLTEMWDGLWPFQGINTFAHLPHHKCLLRPEETYDVALIGVPFDTAVSYRPGARFGPRAIRAASQRQTSLRGFNHRAHFNPYQDWAKVVDCGDIPVTPVDNKLAFEQMDQAFDELLLKRHSQDDPSLPPRYVILGGDHSVILPHLRSLNKLYGPVNLIHFDAHLDTWAPDKYPSFWTSEQAELNHGSMLWKAHEEGLTTKTNIHAGLRTRLTSIDDYHDDDSQDYVRIEADEIWLEGAQKVVDTILKQVPKNTPTYISVDIDVLDPGMAAGTGTQEPGGWLPRELIHVLRSIDDLDIVGADIVEVSPAFDSAEVTATNGAQVAYEIITSMVKKGQLKKKLLKTKQHKSKKANVEQLKEETERIKQKIEELDQTKSQLLSQLEGIRNTNL
jgi:agmatinase